jgi:hypothetical protein
MSKRIWPGRLMTAVGATVAVLGVNGLPASAATFGTPLGTGAFTGAPSNPYDCTQYDTRIAGVFPVQSPAGGPASSCIWTDSSISAQNVSLVPATIGTATVTQVRVAVGQTTGPMEVVVMRALYENTATPGKPLDACCTPVATSQPFTPAPDAVTPVNVDLPMREDPTPAPGDLTTIATFDTLALAVLEAGVPVPMYNTGDPYTSDFLWNTATPSTVTPGFYSDTSGFYVAMQADWTPASGPTGRLVARVMPTLSSTSPLSLVRGARARPMDGCPITPLCIGSQWPLL